MSKQNLAEQKPEQINLLNKTEFAEQDSLFAEQKSAHERFLAEQKQSLFDQIYLDKRLFSKTTDLLSTWLSKSVYRGGNT